MTEAFEMVGWENVSDNPRYLDFLDNSKYSKTGYIRIYKIRFFHPDPEIGEAISDEYRGRVQEFRRIEGSKDEELSVLRVGINAGLVRPHQFKEMAMEWTETPGIHKDAIQANNTGKQMDRGDIDILEREFRKQLTDTPSTPAREIAIEDLERYFSQAYSESVWG